MQFIKIATILLLIAVGSHASDAQGEGHIPDYCTDVNNCIKKLALRHLGHINARRANEVAKAVPEIAV